MKKIILTYSLLLLCLQSFAQLEFWNEIKYETTPEGLKKNDALLVFITFTNSEMKEYGLHEHYMETIYNKYILKYGEKKFSGQKKFMTMTEFKNSKDAYEFAFLPIFWESGRVQGIAPRIFGVVDIKNETAFLRRDRRLGSGETMTTFYGVGSMKSEILLELKFIEKQRMN